MIAALLDGQAAGDGGDLEQVAFLLDLQPLHVARFGDRFDAQGVLAGSKDANRCIGYLTKYLTKHLGDCHELDTGDQAAHAGRLAEALRWEPCSPACANWLRYGIQPKNARKGLRPGACKGKAHRREYLGYAGRRVLTSRKWSGKTLADHRAERKAWLTEMLGLSATDPDPVHLAAGRARGPGPHARRATAAARRRRPDALAPGPRPGPPTSRRTPIRGSFGNLEGSVMSSQHGDDQVSRLLYRVADAAVALSLSRAKVYELISSGALRSVRIDGARRIRAVDLEAFVASLGEEAA